MKKILFLIVAVLLTIPYAAEAQVCFHYSCEYIEDGHFEGTHGWGSGGGNGVTFATISDPCAHVSTPRNTTVAELQNTEYITRTFTTDAHTDWDLEFNLFIVNDTENWYDQLKVTVKNNTTNQTETFYFHGNNTNSSCTKKVLNLANDYDNASVTVKFENSYLATATWQIDNVGFWGTL
ncbi:MAG TPA: hypothetical protein VF618_01080 [Thermoanaerobaculia bacterium]